jgi:hypothetical protein
MKKMIKDKGGNCMIFDELNKKGKVIEYLELTGNINKIDL